MENRYKSIIVVDLILTRRNNGKTEVLLALRKNTGYNDGKYELPGGHVEEGEDLIDAMIREAKEELNINLKRKNLSIVHILHHYKAEHQNLPAEQNRLPAAKVNLLLKISFSYITAERTAPRILLASDKQNHQHSNNRNFRESFPFRS